MVGLYSSRDCPGMVRISQESRDTQTRRVEAGELYPSRDCPGMVRVSQESRDTQTRGVEAGERIHPGTILGWSEYPRNPGILRQGG